MKTVFDLTRDQIITTTKLASSILLLYDIKNIVIIHHDDFIMVKYTFRGTPHWFMECLYINIDLNLIRYSRFYRSEPNILEEKELELAIIYNQREIQVNFLKWGIYPSVTNLKKKIKSKVTTISFYENYS